VCVTVLGRYMLISLVVLCYQTRVCGNSQEAMTGQKSVSPEIFSHTKVLVMKQGTVKLISAALDQLLEPAQIPVK
jgi:hypothetical protein